jgi:hypothetical protein
MFKSSLALSRRHQEEVSSQVSHKNVIILVRPGPFSGTFGLGSPRPLINSFIKEYRVSKYNHQDIKPDISYLPP